MASSALPQLRCGQMCLAGGMLSMVPHFASGGIVTGPTLALIGEAGPEAVVPLGQMGGGIITINDHRQQHK